MSDISGLLQTWLLPGATFALACGTGGLAWYTRKMAKSTEKALEQNARLVLETHELVEGNNKLIESEERHHQENLMPLCVLTPTEPKLGEVGTQLFYNNVREYRETTDIVSLPLTAKIMNNGTGPALNVTVNFYRNCNSNPTETHIGTIASGNSFCVYEDKKQLVTIKTFVRKEEYSLQGIVAIIKSDWVLCIEFSDIFGNKYHTVHKNDPDNLFVEFVRGPDNYCSKIKILP